MKNIIVGVLAIALAVGLMVAFHLHPHKPILQSELVTKSGRLSQVRIEERRKNADNIYLTLPGSTMSYRVEGDFEPGRVAQFQPGAYANISIKKEDLASPRVNKLTKEVWLPIVVLTINKQPIITLAESNDREVKLRTALKWFGPIMVLMGLYAVVSGIRSLRG